MRVSVRYLFILFVLSITAARAQNPQVLMQGWFWDYPKTGQGYNWSDTLRLKAPALGQAGFTHIWYPPFAGNGNKSNGYDPRDLFIGSSQTSIGTLSQIKNMASAMSANGITPVADMVYNHRDGGKPENNPAVKEYMLNYAGSNSGNCQYGSNNMTQTTSYKQPFPSDRVRMAVPLGGSTGLGAGHYYINVNSLSGGYQGKRYLFYVTTNRAGKGSAYDFANGCGPNSSATAINAPNGTYSASLRQGYWVEMNNNKTEFDLNLATSDFNAAGDSLFIQAVNLCGDYTDHRIWKIYYSTGAYDIADQGNQNGGNYKLLFQTYTDFSGLPSGRGSADWRAFRPNWNGQNVSNVNAYNNASRGGYGFGGASGTCLGPQYSQQSLDFFYDYDHSQTSAHDLLIDWTKWTFDELSSKGLRLDAVKHFDPQFVADALSEMYNSGRSPNMIIGEWYGENTNELKGWVDNVTADLRDINSAAAAALPIKVFDFSLRRALKDALDNGANARNVFFNSLRDNKGMSGFNIVTFLNNHDFRSSNASYGDALVRSNPNLGYAYLLTNNQLGVPTVFYPDYYGYPARNTTYGSDTYSFDYLPTGLPAYKTEIDRLMAVLKKYISGSNAVSYLNSYGGTSNGPGSNANYSSGDYNRALIYQLSSIGSAGGKDVIVAINFDTNPLRVNHKVAIQNSVNQGTRFTDILGRSNFPYAVVNNDAGITNSIYIDLPARSYSVWVQDAAPLSVSLTSTTVCAGQSNTLTAAVSGGNAPYAYTFSSGATTVPGSTSMATVTTSGTYSVTVTDNLGVSTTATVSSTFNSAPTATISASPSATLTCANNSITLTAGGGSSYRFSNGATQLGTSNQATVSTTGTYSVTATDANGCSGTASIGISSNMATITVTNPTTSTAAVSVAFSQTFTASGGTGPYQFSIASGTPAPGLSLASSGVLSGTPTQSGSFTITVNARDANGCANARQAANGRAASNPYVLTVKNAPLPVTLTSFSVSRFSEQAIGIEWQTAQETNADFFEVQRSTDAREFTSLTRVQAEGNTTTLHNYRYLDTQPLLSTTYYRLRMVDQDGTFSYSRIMAIAPDDTQPLLRLVENPVASGTAVRVWLRGFDTDALSLHQSNGQRIAVQTQRLADGSVRISLSTPLTPGIYIVRAGQGAGALSVRLLVH